MRVRIQSIFDGSMPIATEVLVITIIPHKPIRRGPIGMILGPKDSCILIRDLIPIAERVRPKALIHLIIFANQVLQVRININKILQ